MDKDQLTKQDKTFVEEVVKTGNQTLSAKKAYGIKTDEYAGKKGSLKVREGKIQEAIKSIADSIPNDLLLKVHTEGLNAENKIIKGEETVTIPDYGVRHKYLDSAYKLKKLYEENKVDINIGINLSEMFKKTKKANE